MYLVIRFEIPVQVFKSIFSKECAGTISYIEIISGLDYILCLCVSEFLDKAVVLFGNFAGIIT